MHKNLTRILSAVLIALVTVSMPVACASSGDSTTDTTAAPAASTTAASAETTAPAVEPEYAYADVDYKGADFAMLNAADRYDMLYRLMPSELNGESLNDTRFKLNQSVAERYGITLKETQIAYNDLLTYAQNEVLANIPVHDVFFLSGKQIAALMNAGYLHNLLEVDKLNLEEDYWDQTLIEDGTLKEKYLYYLGGNYHLQGFEGTTCIFFNKKMLQDLGLEEPYGLVREGKWTMDELYAYAARGANLNGDTSFTYNESGSAIYGIATIANLMPAFIMGCDAYYVEKNEADEPVLSFTSEHFQNVCAKIATLTSAEGVYHPKKEVSLFMQNRALMIGAEIKAAANEMRDMENAFGMLPMPKYDEKQENYVTNMYWATHLLAIPVTCADIDRAAIVMDTLHYEAQRDLLPVYYERVCYKGLRDQDSIDMLEIIRETRYLNWGLSYDWLGSIEPSVHDMLLGGNGNVASLANSASRMVDRLIKKTMDSLGGK